MIMQTKELLQCLDEMMERIAQNNKAIGLVLKGYRRSDDGYQPEPDIHDIEMVGSELWIKDKEEK